MLDDKPTLCRCSHPKDWHEHTVGACLECACRRYERRREGEELRPRTILDVTEGRESFDE